MAFQRGKSKRHRFCLRRASFFAYQAEIDMAATTKGRLRELKEGREFIPPLEDVRSEDWSAFEPEEGTLARIIYLLACPDSGRFGSLTRLSEESGIARASLTRIVLLARDGIPVHPTDATFQKLHALLEELDPPLTELRNLRPIQFEDWYALKRFHNESQLGADLSRSETDELIHQILSLSSEQQEAVSQFVHELTKGAIIPADPDRGIPTEVNLRNLIKQLDTMAINNLARLILYNAAQRNISLLQLAELMAGDDIEDVPRLERGLRQITEGVLPEDVLLLSELARVLQSPDGVVFHGDIDDLLRFCGMSQKKHLASNNGY